MLASAGTRLEFGLLCDGCHDGVKLFEAIRESIIFLPWASAGCRLTSQLQLVAVRPGGYHQEPVRLGGLPPGARPAGRASSRSRNPNSLIPGGSPPGRAGYQSEYRLNSQLQLVAVRPGGYHQEPVRPDGLPVEVGLRPTAQFQVVARPAGRATTRNMSTDSPSKFPNFNFDFHRLFSLS